MATLYEVLKKAESEGVVVGHFNVSDTVTFKSVFQSASDQNVPVIVGLSEGEREFFGVRQAALMVKSLHQLPSSAFQRAKAKPQGSWGEVTIF
jgi:fructose-bisphosphate aldolase, class II